MGTAIVAAAAAILGALLAGLQQERRERIAHREQTERQRKEALAAALQELLKAATWNRNRQYAKHDDRREGRDDTREERDIRYAAHSRLTDALSALVGLTTDETLLYSARCLVDTSIAVSGLTTATHDRVRDEARVAHDAMLRAITRHNQLTS